MQLRKGISKQNGYTVEQQILNVEDFTSQRFFKNIF